ncbi:hypothetical protein [Legionella sainthelensi]|uniref:hypothetical protein n=1 Tax=Legionella sainthelensi TaxID=28087 RepID=UPI00135A9586|nr:hypothetical protein [Legionella sainthelensi]
MPYILPAAKHPALSLPETTGLARPSLPWPAAGVREGWVIIVFFHPGHEKLLR